MSTKMPKVEITIPVYNEEVELEKHITILARFCEKNLTSYDWHITIADNASTDNTQSIAEKLAKKNTRVRVYRLEEKGRGRAVKSVWRDSKADFCVYMDLDLSTDLIHLPRVLKALQDGNDIAIGS